MNSHPPRWSDTELSADAIRSAAQFRADRLAVSDAWERHYQEARRKFESLFAQLDDLTALNRSTDGEQKLQEAYGMNLGEALRYLAGPPISDDDLQVIADVDTITSGVLRHDARALRKVFAVIERVIDPHRFPWVRAGTAPTPAQREAALMASSVLLASQRIATERRTHGKNNQESSLKQYLQSLGYTEVRATAINTIVRGPQANQFCAECQLGERKADVVIRLHDTRLMAVECKASNSATNSVKRLNNDAAVKAEYWLKQFGAAQVVPAATLCGVFNVLNLQQAQARGLSLFWSHDLGKLGEFLAASR